MAQYSLVKTIVFAFNPFCEKFEYKIKKLIFKTTVIKYILILIHFGVPKIATPKNKSQHTWAIIATWTVF